MSEMGERSPDVERMLRQILELFPLSLVDVVSDLLEEVARKFKDRDLLWRIRVERYDPRTPQEASDILVGFSEEIWTRPLLDSTVDESLKVLESQGVLGERNLRRLLRFFEVLQRTGTRQLVFDGMFFGVRDEWFGTDEIRQIAESYLDHDPEWGKKAVQEVLSPKTKKPG